MKSKIKLLIGIVFLIVFIVYAIFYLANPLRHSMEVEEFRRLLKDTTNFCGLEEIELRSIEFDKERIPFYEKYYLFLRRIIKDEALSYFHCKYISNQYVFSRNKDSIVLQSLGLNNKIFQLNIIVKSENKMEDCINKFKIEFTRITTRIDIEP